MLKKLFYEIKNIFALYDEIDWMYFIIIQVAFFIIGFFLGKVNCHH